MLRVAGCPLCASVFSVVKPSKL